MLFCCIIDTVIIGIKVTLNVHLILENICKYCCLFLFSYFVCVFLHKVHKSVCKRERKSELCIACTFTLICFMCHFLDTPSNWMSQFFCCFVSNTIFLFIIKLLLSTTILVNVNINAVNQHRFDQHQRNRAQHWINAELKIENVNKLEIINNQKINYITSKKD